MKEIYKLKPSENIPSNSKKTFPLWNWYVKPEIINRKKYVLFLEREYYLSVWVEGATSKNISELFRNQLEIVLEITGIPLSEIENLKIQEREIYFGKTSDKVWIGVSNEVVNCSRDYLEESQITTSGLKPLVLYKPNTMLFGGPNYKIPEDELRKFFGEKPKVRNW